MPITRLNSSRDFFRIWFLWKFQALLVFVAIVGAVMFYAYGSTPVYESRAKVLLLPKTNEDMVITASSTDRQIIRPVTNEDLNTEVELILSDNVIQETVRVIDEKALGLKTDDPGVYDVLSRGIRGFFRKLLGVLALTEEPVSEFEKRAMLLRRSLDIEPAFQSNVLLLRLRGENAQGTAQVLSRLLETYLRRHGEVFTLNAGIDFYDDQAGTYLKRLEDAEKAVQDFSTEYSIVDLQNQNIANIELMSELNKELQLLEITYDEAASRIKILGQVLEDEGAEVVVTAEMRVIPAIVELEKALVPLVIKKTEIARLYTPESREYRHIEEQLNELQVALKGEVRKALATDRIELSTLRAKKDSLKRKIGELEERATNFNQLRTRAQELERQVQIHKNHYLVYSSKMEDSRVYSEKKDHNLANVTVVDQPVVPERPVAPKKLLLLVSSLFLGVLSSLCLPFVLEAWDHKLKTVDDVERLLAVQVISSFPEVGK